MRVKGKVIKWQNDKGFGFIKPINGMPDIFFHEDSLISQSRRPKVGNEVSFEIATNPEGKQRAERILFRGERDPRQRDRFLDVFYSGLSITFLVCVGILVFLKKLDPIFLILYLLLSLITFLIYWSDKNKANNNEWRTSEKKLNFFSLIGGWPGALIAQRLLHHKSRKKSFLIRYYVTVILNISAISIYYFSGEKFLKYDSVINNFNKITQQVTRNFQDESNQKQQGPIYSWVNKDGKRVYSNVGFPPNEQYRDGKIEWK